MIAGKLGVRFWPSGDGCQDRATISATDPFLPFVFCQHNRHFIWLAPATALAETVDCLFVAVA
jgi:hypothetical protein